jgi:hypothetical protein
MIKIESLFGPLLSPRGFDSFRQGLLHFRCPKNAESVLSAGRKKGWVLPCLFTKPGTLPLQASVIGFEHLK